MSKSHFKGLGVAMVTPFDEQQNIDFPALEKLTNFLIEGGVDYLVVQGTTGESPVLSKEEKQQVLDAVISTTQARIPIVFGIGGNNTAAVVSDILSYDLTKVDGILSASPYYNKPTQEGIYQHYARLAGATEKPIILYNVPGRTASNILAETTLRLATDFSNVVAVKEASGNMEQIMEIIQKKPSDFLVISGDDALTLPILSSGGDGVISVVGNAFPFAFSNMVHAALEDEMEKAREYHYGVFPVIDMLFREGNPAGVKEALKTLEIMDNHLRLPLVNVSDKLASEIHEMTRNIYNRFPYQN